MSEFRRREISVPGHAASLASMTGSVVVDLAQIATNWGNLQDFVGPKVTCGAVVKANAYGLGAKRVIPALSRAGCSVFFVATPDEGREARELAPNATIYALDGLIPGAEAHFARHQIRPVLSSPPEIEAWAKYAQRNGTAHRAALHIDSGLHRLGVSTRDVRRLAQDAALLSTLNLTLVMSHLASADNPADLQNRDQLLAFETLSAILPNIPRSLAASDGLMLGKHFHFDLVRPGYALYGGQASQSHPAPVKPAVTVKARILAVNDLAPGESIGYSATWRAQRPSRIATIAAGYADGVPRAASATNDQAGGHVAICGRLAPIVGRVSMDLITVDLTDLPPGMGAAGEFVTLVGPEIPLEDAGYAASTIGYEILTRLGGRFERLYLGDDA